jgi:hypothetical protein
MGQAVNCNAIPSFSHLQCCTLTLIAGLKHSTSHSMPNAFAYNDDRCSIVRCKAQNEGRILRNPVNEL